LGLIVPVRDHRFVIECKTKRNKIDVLWEDSERTADTAMKKEKKLRLAVALFALNPSTTFCRVHKARKKM